MPKAKVARGAYVGRKLTQNAKRCVNFSTAVATKISGSASHRTHKRRLLTTSMTQLDPPPEGSLKVKKDQVPPGGLGGGG